MATSNERHNMKVSIIGAGRVGITCAYSILQQNIAREISLFGSSANRLKGEQIDLQHGLSFTDNCDIQASTDFSVTAHSVVCIVSASMPYEEDVDDEERTRRNIELFKKIIPPVARQSPHAILLIVSRPVDILSYVAWKLSGFPRERVMGLGTNMESSRFSFLIANRLNMASDCCHGCIIGEQGESSIPVWSSLNVAGVHLEDVFPESFKADEQWHDELHNKVNESAKEIINLKGYISWAVGMSVACIVKSILDNGHDTFVPSINVKGYHGVEEDVFLSLPCVIGKKGVCEVIKQNLSERERTDFQKSAERLLKQLKAIQL